MSDSSDADVPARGRSRRRPSVLTVVGLALLLSGLGCLGWLGYQYVGTNLVAERQFDTERSQLRSQWQQPSPSPVTPSSTPAPAPLPGDAIALLRVPAFGQDFEVPVLEGTDLDTLANGVGHYPGTASPGQVGNVALAGHRVTHGRPFGRLLDLNPGDQVVLETRTAIYTYVLDTAPRSLTVADTATWVLDPVPGEPATEPTRALLTLTTCQDLFRSPDRSIAFGHLQSTQNKAR